MKALIVPHHERDEVVDLAAQAAAWLHARGHEAWLRPDDALAIGCPELAADRPVTEATLAISLGGDGTMLRTVELLGGEPTPVLGVNVGVLGYLPEVEPAQLAGALQRYADGDYEIEERMLVEVALMRRNGDPERWRALNEGVIEKCGNGHTVRLLVSIDGALFTSYVADGLIVATPTGSTAYSLSARGPIVSPRHRAVLLTPVSPHMLFDRSLVLDPDEVVTIELAGHRPASLSVDGRPVATLETGDAVVYRGAKEVARLVRFGRRDFHQILKAKFGLSDR
jgi:NAD+ kinase